MRQIVFAHHGDPADVLVLAHRPVPEPGPRQVRVRMSARPVNPSDLLLVEGRYGRPASFVPGLHPDGVHAAAPVGFEGVGVIDRAGPDACHPVGTRVAVSAPGTWAEYVIADHQDAHPVPLELSDGAACRLTVNPVTANLLLESLAMELDDLVLFTAGASSVARMMIRLAHLRGVRCVALVRDRRHRRSLMETGAFAVLREDEPALERQLSEIAATRGIQAVADAVGGPVADLALRVLRPHGRFVSYGLLSGLPVTVRPEDLLFRGITMTGFWLPERLSRLTPGEVGDVMARAAAQLADGTIEVPEAETFELSDVRSAVRHSREAGHLSKAVLVG
ncbi:zinc-dependent alcohol dehydrogenase family protein [Streptomyces sp. sk226]|uniref:zinc-dependent alcohol dehydrogenase family protein n=1 Tax=Streptomyces sp. sk226 TaxID=2034268 RepID=UPI000BF14EB9|nr:zinc-dependent alcohol dehydrogenase family protein [Streptomyces sp. sk226]